MLQVFKKATKSRVYDKGDLLSICSLQCKGFVEDVSFEPGVQECLSGR